MGSCRSSSSRIRSEIAAGLASKSDAETDKKKLDDAYSDIRKTLTDYYKPRYLAGDEATRQDIYNKLIPEYLEHSATVTAVVLYGLSNLDHLLSRDGLYK